MVSRNRVTNVQKAVSSIDRVTRSDSSLGRLEEWRVVDVGGCVIPRVELTLGSVEVLPHLAALQDVAVSFFEHIGIDDALSDSTDFITGWPDVSQENIVALLVLAERLSLEIEVDRSSKSIGNDERRRSEVVGAGVWVDTALKVTVSREHS